MFGAALSDRVETGARNLTLIGTTLIVLGLVLLAAEKLGTQTRQLDTLRWRDGILNGFAQAAALVPGVSRSGATISAGLFLGLERAAAARYSFLLSIPAIVLSGIIVQQVARFMNVPRVAGAATQPPKRRPIWTERNSSQSSIESAPRLSRSRWIFGRPSTD